MAGKVDWIARAQIFTDMAARYRLLGGAHHELLAQQAEREAVKLLAKAGR